MFQQMCHYRTSCLCRVPVTLGKAPDGKRVFADCHFSGTRQRGCREPRQICHVGAAADGAFAECLTAGTRQRPKLCRVPGFGTWESLKLCRMPAGWHSAKFQTLPSVKLLALGKVAFFGIPLMATFAECFSLCTRQSDQIFFIPFFSIFRYKYNKNISEYRDITGSYYNKYIIDK